MQIHRNLISAAVASALTGTSIAQAQQAEQPLEEVMVTGSRITQAITDVSGSVIVVNADQIEKIQASNFSDLLDYTPGVDVATDARYGIRSINIRGLEGNYVKVKVDNVDAPAEFESGRNLIASSRIDTDIDMIRSVEITRGPASTSHGSDAIGGLVLIQTKDAADFVDNRGWGGHAKMDYDDSSEGFRQSYALAYRSDAWDTVVSFSDLDAGGVDDYFNLYKDDTEQQTASFKSTYSFNIDHALRLSANWSNTDSFQQEDKQVDENFQYTDDNAELLRYGLRYIGSFDKPLLDTVNLQLDWQEKETNTRGYRYVPAQPPYYPVPFNELKDYNYSEQGYTLDIQFNKQQDTGSVGHNIAYGATFRDTEYENINITRDDSDLDGIYDDFSERFYYIPGSDYTSLGIFLLDELSFLDGDLLVSPGIRYDRFEHQPFDTAPSQADTPVNGWSPTNSYQDFEDSETTFRLGAVYAFNEGLRGFGQYAQGFKAPDFNQLYYSYANHTVGYKSEPNPDLKSETSDAYELGLRYNSSWFDLELTGFYSEFDDFIDVAWDYTNPEFRVGVQRNVNVNEADIKGVEFSSSFTGESLLPGSYATLAFSYTKGEDGEGDALLSVPPWSGVLGLNYDSPSNHWGTSLFYRYYHSVDASDFASDQYAADSASIIDLTLYYRPWEKLTLRAGVYNLTDEKWYRWNNISGLPDEEATPGELNQLAEPKRSFTLTAKFDF